MLLPHLILLVNRNTLCFWQMIMLQMVLGKVQMKDLIPALPLFHKIPFISLVKPFFYFQGLLKSHPSSFLLPLSLSL